MLSPADIHANFSQVVELPGGDLRFEIKLPKKRFVHRLRFGRADGGWPDLLTVVEDLDDDEFAKEVLDAAHGHTMPDGLAIVPFSNRTRAFDRVLLAGPSFHGTFMGILDPQRARLVLCIPINHCEFAGNEDRQTFADMCFGIVPTRDWNREPVPKFQLRFSNPRTRGGTSDGYVQVRLRVLLLEIGNLNGVDQGFIEIVNHRGQVVEVLSPRPDAYIHIVDRDDSTRRWMSVDELLEELHAFLRD